MTKYQDTTQSCKKQSHLLNHTICTNNHVFQIKQTKKHSNCNHSWTDLIDWRPQCCWWRWWWGGRWRWLDKYGLLARKGLGGQLAIAASSAQDPGRDHHQRDDGDDDGGDGDDEDGGGDGDDDFFWTSALDLKRIMVIVMLRTIKMAMVVMVLMMMTMTWSESHNTLST